jgi:bacterioferritin-associated ferredoxin
MYVCNCNGIRERDVREAIESGASCAGEVFVKHECRVRCGRCVQDMQVMIRSVQVIENIAAE